MAGGGFQEMDSLLKQAQEMQRNLARMQEELRAREVEGQAGGGVVRAVVNGQGELLQIRIRPEAVDPADVGALEDAVQAAVSAALRSAARLKQEQLERLTGGMVPPGFF